MYSVGIDLGGTNIAVALVSPEGKIRAKTSTSTPHVQGENLPRQVATAMVETMLSLLEKEHITLSQLRSIGIGSPGTIDTKTQTIGYWSNLNFRNVPLGALLTEILQENHTKIPPLYLENDANTAALGEFYAGAGKEGQSLVAITLGTGVGGGAILDGKLFSGHNGAGMEVGHFVLHTGGKKCTCGRLGCFEAYSSATALIQQTKEAMKEHPDSLLWTLVEQDLEQVNGKTVFDAIEQGDKIAKGIFDQYIIYLASGLTSVINLFQPEILCLGGGIAGQKETLLHPLLEIINQEDYARNLSQRCTVTLAELGNDAGLIGAAGLAQFQ